MQLIYIALGGALGALARALVGTVLAFPLATLAVNAVGSLLIGFAFGLGLGERPIAPFLLIGVLGGFTTFSTFSLDALKLVQSGAVGAAFGYVLASVVLSLLAVAGGYILGGRLT